MFRLLDLGGVYEAVVVRRLSRFEVLLKLGEELVVAHNTNTGRLHDILVEGSNALIIAISGKKLRYRLVGVESRNGLYSIVDVLTQEAAFRKALTLGLVPYLSGCSIVRRNPRLGTAVHDYLLSCTRGYAVVEVKSAEFAGPRGEAMYPDCPTPRGRRHIANLIRLSKELGLITYLIFIAALPRPKCFMPYKEADPVVDRLVREALSSGVEVRGVAIFMDRWGRIYLEEPDLPICSYWLYG